MDHLLLIIEASAVAHTLWLGLKTLCLRGFPCRWQRCHKQHMTITSFSAPCNKDKLSRYRCKWGMKTHSALPRRVSSALCSPRRNFAAKSFRGQSKMRPPNRDCRRPESPPEPASEPCPPCRPGAASLGVGLRCHPLLRLLRAEVRRPAASFHTHTWLIINARTCDTYLFTVPFPCCQTTSYGKFGVQLIVCEFSVNTTKHQKKFSICIISPLLVSPSSFPSRACLFSQLFSCAFLSCQERGGPELWSVSLCPQLSRPPSRDGPQGRTLWPSGSSFSIQSLPLALLSNLLLFCSASSL